MKDHGTLPDRPYDNNGGDEIVSDDKTDDAVEGTESVIPDVTGAPMDPSVGDLPKKSGPTPRPNPIQEERKD